MGSETHFIVGTFIRQTLLFRSVVAIHMIHTIHMIHMIHLIHMIYMIHMIHMIHMIPFLLIDAIHIILG